MSAVDSMMKEAIRQGVFPGAALLFAQGEMVLHQQGYGHATLLPRPVPLALDTSFDVSSLSKVLATTAIAMRLFERALLDLEEPIVRTLPEFRLSPYESVTVRHLLEHTSGLPAYRPYFERFAPTVPTDSMPAQYLQWIAAEPREGEIGATRRYSDLGFIALGVWLERLTALSLRELYRREVCLPLNLAHTGYGPLPASAKVAATEQDPWRGRLLAGEVHDENAYLLGGAAGHAGVFTTATDCHTFASELCRAWQGKSAWLSAGTVARFLGKDLTFCLGWDRPSRPHSQAGRYFSERAVGHLGFTGCSLWIELERGIIAILFTNRVHPRRGNEKIKGFRPRIHEALFECYLATAH